MFSPISNRKTVIKLQLIYCFTVELHSNLMGIPSHFKTSELQELFLAAVFPFPSFPDAGIPWNGGLKETQLATQGPQLNFGKVELCTQTPQLDL